MRKSLRLQIDEIVKKYNLSEETKKDIERLSLKSYIIGKQEIFKNSSINCSIDNPMYFSPLFLKNTKNSINNCLSSIILLIKNHFCN